jgi:Crp-like helix-turn-helix domain
VSFPAEYTSAPFRRAFRRWIEPIATLSFTPEFLSEMLSVQRTTVNWVIKQLEDAGVVLRRRGLVEIIDRQALEAVGMLIVIFGTQLTVRVDATT